MATLSEEFLQQIRDAQTAAMQAVNAKVEVFWSTPSNWEKVRRIVTETVPQTNWSNVSVWVSALVGAAAEPGFLQNRPTPAEVAARRAAADKADGSLSTNSHARPGTERVTRSEREEARDWMKGMIDDLTNPGSRPKPPKPVAPSASSLVESFPIDSDIQNWEPSMQKAFRLLPSEAIRLWSKRRQDFQWQEKYGKKGDE